MTGRSRGRHDFTALKKLSSGLSALAEENKMVLRQLTISSPATQGMYGCMRGGEWDVGRESSAQLVNTTRKAMCLGRSWPKLLTGYQPNSSGLARCCGTTPSSPRIAVWARTWTLSASGCGLHTEKTRSLAILTHSRLPRPACWLS